MIYIKDFFDKMLISEGRTSRKDFWYTILYMMIFNIVFSIIFGLIANIIGTIIKLPTLVRIVLFVVNAIILLSTVSLQIRRLHDTNKSTLFIFFNLIPVIGQLIVLYFYCLPGDAEANDYGAPVSL